MRSIEIQTIPKGKRGDMLIRAIRNGEELGKLDYKPLPTKAFAQMGLLFVNSQYRGEGVARQILQEFARRCGQGTEVSASVVHDETRKKIREKNFPQNEIRRKTVIIDNPEELEELPLVKILYSGNIHTNAIEVVLNPQLLSPLYRLSLKGSVR